VKAPIAKGQTVGKLVVTAPDTDTIETPLVATQAVDRLDAFSRVGAGVGYLLLGRKN
jgi:D-alanyl-D-alanine carboxypeptidase (penicillin-binding protein 5/6)